VKSIERIGLRGNSSLVIIGEKESKTDPYTVFAHSVSTYEPRQNRQFEQRR